MTRIRISLAILIATGLLGVLCFSEPSRTPPAPSAPDTLATPPTENPPDCQLQLNQLNTRLDNLSWSLGKVTQLLRDDLTETMENTELETHRTQSQLSELGKGQLQLRQDVKRAQSQTDSLGKLLDTLRHADRALQERELMLEDSLQQLAFSTQKEIGSLWSNLSIHRLLIGIIVLISAGALTAVVLYRLKHREDKEEIEERMRLNARILKLLDQHLQMMNIMGMEQREEGKVINHALAVRVGIELFRMQKGIEKIDPEVKGISALKHALALLEEEFIRQGYAIRDLTGQLYQSESNVKVKKSVVNDQVAPGKPLIERVITPQVIYMGEVVHPGEVEIAISPQDK